MGPFFLRATHDGEIDTTVIPVLTPPVGHSKYRYASCRYGGLLTKVHRAKCNNSLGTIEVYIV